MLAKPDLDETSLDMLGVANLIEEKGWCQNNFEDPEGRMCLVGAITRYIVRKNLAGDISATDLFERSYAINKRLNLPTSSIYWNDQPARTKEQVVERLRSAAYGLLEE